MTNVEIAHRRHRRRHHHPRRDRHSKGSIDLGDRRRHADARQLRQRRCTVSNVETLVGGASIDTITLGAALTSDGNIDLGAGNDKLTLGNFANAGTRLQRRDRSIGGSAADTIIFSTAFERRLYRPRRRHRFADAVGSRRQHGDDLATSRASSAARPATPITLGAPASNATIDLELGHRQADVRQLRQRRDGHQRRDHHRRRPGRQHHARNGALRPSPSTSAPAPTSSTSATSPTRAPLRTSRSLYGGSGCRHHHLRQGCVEGLRRSRRWHRHADPRCTARTRSRSRTSKASSAARGVDTVTLERRADQRQQHRSRRRQGQPASSATSTTRARSRTSRSLIGGTGADTITYATIVTSGSINLGKGDDTLTLGDFANIATISGVESLLGGSANDTITLGDAASNATIDLGSGSDKLTLGKFANVATDHATQRPSSAATSPTPSRSATPLSGVTVDLGAGNDKLYLGDFANSGSASNVESLYGGSARPIPSRSARPCPRALSISATARYADAGQWREHGHGRQR